MRTVTLAEAKQYLGSLVEMIEAGEEVTITVDGIPVARMIAPRKVSQQLPSFADLRSRLPMQAESAGDFMRRLRDSERY